MPEIRDADIQGASLAQLVCQEFKAGINPRDQVLVGIAEEADRLESLLRNAALDGSTRRLPASITAQISTRRVTALSKLHEAMNARDVRAASAEPLKLVARAVIIMKNELKKAGASSEMIETVVTVTLQNLQAELMGGDAPIPKISE